LMGHTPSSPFYLPLKNLSKSVHFTLLQTPHLDKICSRVDL
jgi:hypothetical protein